MTLNRIAAGLLTLSLALLFAWATAAGLANIRLRVILGGGIVLGMIYVIMGRLPIGWWLPAVDSSLRMMILTISRLGSSADLVRWARDWDCRLVRWALVAVRQRRMPNAVSLPGYPATYSPRHRSVLA